MASNFFDQADTAPQSVEPTQPPQGRSVYETSGNLDSASVDYTPLADDLASQNRRELLNQFGRDIWDEVKTKVQPSPSAFDIYEEIDQKPPRETTVFESIGMSQTGRSIGDVSKMIGGSLQQLGESGQRAAADQITRSEILDTPSRLGTLRGGQGTGMARVGQRMEDWGREMTAAQPKPTVTDYTKIDSAAALGQYVWDTLQQAAVTGGTIIGSAAIGGAPAALLAGWGLGVGGMRDAIETERDKIFDLANQARAMGLDIAAERYEKVARDLTPEKQAQIIYAAGTLIGALDSIVPLAIMKELSDSRPLKEMTAKAIIGAMTAAMVKGGGQEAITEAAQQVVQVLAVARAKGAQGAADYIQELEDNRVEIIDSAIRGGIGGAGFGTVTGAKRVAAGPERPKPEGNIFDAADPAPEVAPPTEINPPADATGAPLEAGQAPTSEQDIEQVVETWRYVQDAREQGLDGLESSMDAPVFEQERLGVDRLIEDLPPEIVEAMPDTSAPLSDWQEFLTQVSSQATGEEQQHIIQQVSERLAEVEQAIAMKRDLDRLGLSEARSEDEVRQILRGAGSTAAAGAGGAPGDQAAPGTQAAARLEQYLAQGGSLTGQPDAIAKASGLQNTAELTQALRSGVSSGALRQTMTGRLAPVQQTRPKTGDGVKQTIADLARAMAPMLPRGTTVKSFADLASIPQRNQAGLEQRGDRVVDAKSGSEIEAFADDDTIYLADYALRPGGRLSHEAVHVLKSAGLISPSEMKLLADRARKTGAFTKRDEAQYRKAYAARYPADLESRIDEEAAAHLIEARVNGEDFGRKINGILDRLLEFIRRLGNALRGMGFQTTDDVANALMSGEMARREAVQAWMRENDISALAVRDPQMMAAFANNETDDVRKQRAQALGFDTSKVWYHGTHAEPFDAFKPKSFHDSKTPVVWLAPDAGMPNAMLSSGTFRFDSLMHDGARIIPVYVRPGKQLVVDGSGQGPFTIGEAYFASERTAAYEEALNNARRLAGLGWSALFNEIKTLDDYKQFSKMANYYGTDQKFWGDEAKEKGKAIMLFHKFAEQRANLSDALYESAINNKVATGEMFDDAASKGYTSILIKNMTDNNGWQDQLVMLDPKDIRSVNAEFSPWGAASSNLMFAFANHLVNQNRDPITGNRITKAGTTPEAEAKWSAILDALPVDKREAAKIERRRMEAVNKRGQMMFALADQEAGQGMRRDLDALGYYSQALEAARSLKQAKGTPEQMLAQLKNAGVKQSEIEATKLGEFLQGKPSITRDEIVKHLEDNRVGLKEVGYGPLREKIDKNSKYALPQVLRAVEQSGDTPGDLALTLANDGDAYRALTRRFPELREDEDWADTVAQSVFGGDSRPAGTAKWQNHSLDPSNPSYRETVLHLPGIEDDPAWMEMSKRIAQIGEQRHALSREFLSAGRDRRVEIDAEEERLTAERNDLVAKRDDHERSLPVFETGHFPEPNIVGHMMTSMTRHEGKAVYTVDQIQSDWGQKLRDGGVRDEAKIARLEAAANAAYQRRINVETDAGNLMLANRALSAPEVGQTVPWGTAAGLSETGAAMYDGRHLVNGVTETPVRVGNWAGKIDYWPVSYNWKGEPGPPVYIGRSDNGNVQNARGASFDDVMAVFQAAHDGRPTRELILDFRELAEQRGDAQLSAELGRLSSEYTQARSTEQLTHAEHETAKASVTGNPLVNTTDQWVNTTLRRALRQAAEADAAYMAIPHGDTVLSYNPGDTDGMRGFYGSRTSEGIVPKNLRKLIEKIDKDSATPTKIDQLETPSGMKGHGFTLFPLTDKIKRSVINDGQVMFAFAGEKARTADLEALAKAKQMEANGAKIEAIWTDTGWFRAPDGRWLHERVAMEDQPIKYLEEAAAVAASDMRGNVLPPSYVVPRIALQLPHVVVRDDWKGQRGENLHAKGRSGIVDSVVQDDGTRRLSSRIFERSDRGVGLGMALYRGVIDEAHKRGETITSDATVSESAQRIYAGLRDRGYGVEQHPEAKMDRHGSIQTIGVGGSPGVFRVTPPNGFADALLKAAAKRMDLTPSERRARPPWLDYDVPEDQQIVRFADGQSVSQKSYSAEPPVEGFPTIKGNVMFAIRAFHNSPHDFDRFDTSKVGTGEGAILPDGETSTAQGWGMYFSLEDQSNRFVGPGKFAKHSYEVRLNIDDDKMLDMERRMSQQSDFVKNALKLAGYGDARTVFGLVSEKSEPEKKQVAEALRSVGIQGVYYGNKADPDVGRNAVVFDDSMIEIVAKDGKPVEASDRQSVIDGMTAKPGPMFAMRDLDMSPEARKARAEEMGFDTSKVWYHGTNSQFDAFARVDGGNAFGDAHYFTENSGRAGDYALGENVNRITPRGNAWPNVLPVYLRANKLFDGRVVLTKAELREIETALLNDPLGSEWKKGEFSKTFERAYPPNGDNVAQTISYNPNDVNRILIAAGYDGRISGDVVNGKTAIGNRQVAIFDPRNIRSINAAFDPSESSSPNLMFAMRDTGETDAPEIKSLQSIVADLARDMGLVMRQGLTKTAAGKAASRAGLRGVYDANTGVLRVRSVSDIQAVAAAAAPVMRHRFGKALDALVAKHGRELSNPTGSKLKTELLSEAQAELVAAVETFAEFQRNASPQTRITRTREENTAADSQFRASRDAAEAAMAILRQRVGEPMAKVLRDTIIGKLDIADLAHAEPLPKGLVSSYVSETYDPSLNKAPPPVPADVNLAEMGWSDFMRQYITNPAQARATFPRFLRAFESFLAKNDDILLAKLESAQEAIDAYYKADPTRFVDAILHDPAKPGRWDRFKADVDQWGYKGALSMRMSSWYTASVDKDNPMFMAVRELLNEINRSTGSKIDIATQENPYKLLRLAPHSHAWATRDMENGVRDRTTNEHVGPGLISALTTALGTNRHEARDTGPGSAYRAFSSYLVAKYAAVEWQRFADGTKERAPTVMPPRSADPAQAVAFYNETVAQLDAKYPAFAGAAEMIYDYQQQLLKLQRDGGLITPETHDTLIQDRTYVPFYREFGEDENIPSRALSAGSGGILKRKRGSDRNVIDPIASIAQKTFETRSLIAVNDVKRQLLKLAEAAGPGGGVIAERIDPKQLSGMGIDVTQVLRSVAADLDVDDGDKAALIALAHQVLGNDAVATYYTQKTITPGGKPIVFFFEGGQLQAMQLGNGGHGHKLAAQILDSLNTFGKVHTDAMSGLIEVGRAPAQLVRIGVTTHPEFAAANLVRDAVMAFQYDKRALPLWTQVKGAIDVARGADYVQRYYANAGMMGGEATSALDKLRIDRDTKALIERGYKFKLFDSFDNFWSHFKDAMKEGMGGAALAAGAVGGFVGGAAVGGPLGGIAGAAAGSAGAMAGLQKLGMGRNAYDKATGLAVGAIAGAALGGPVGAALGGLVGRTVGGTALVKVGEASETATRAQLFEIAYQRGIANGLDEAAAAQEAAFWAHDYTDYSRRGSKMEGFAAIIPFLNANIQGNDVYLRRLLGKGDQGYNPGLLYPLYRLGYLDINALSEKEQRELGESAWTWGMTILGLGAITAAVAMLWSDDERIKDIDDRVKAGHWLIPVGDTVVRIPKPFQTVWFAQLVERWITEGAHGNARWFEHYIEDLWNTWKPPMTPAIAEIGATALGYDINAGRQIIPDHVKRANPDRTKQADAYTSEFGKWAGPKLDTAPMLVDHMITKFGATWGRTALGLNVPGTPWYNETKPIKGPEEEFIARRFLWKVGRGSEAGQAMRQIMGAEEPLNLLWGRLAQPYSNLKKSADNYRDLIDKPIPDHAGAVGLLEVMSPAERGYALMEGTLRGRDDAKYRMLHPMNRASKIATEIMKLEKEIVGGELLSGRKGKDLKEIPLTPSEKTATRDMLTQLRMMETHNALVLTEEVGWKGRVMFKPETVMAELKAAAPNAHKELLARFTKAGILPWDGVARTWPEVKQRLENPQLLERARRNRMVGAGAQFAAAYERARAARPGSYQPVEELAPQN